MGLMDVKILLAKIESYLDDEARNQWQRFVNEDGTELDFDSIDLLQEALEHIYEGDMQEVIRALGIIESVNAIAAVNRMIDEMGVTVKEIADDAAEWSRAQAHGIPGIMRYHGVSMSDFV